MEAVEEAWWHLWQGCPARKPDVEKLFAPLAQVPCLTRKTAMTPELLHEMGRRMGVNKAAGMDDWGGAHLRLWPLALWEWVSELFEEVELRGRWPEELRGGIVSMLPKGNTGNPLDHRPVVLLPVLYRMWARVRAREHDRWMQTSGLGALPGRSKGAEEHGLLFALALEYARARGECAGGLALDFSKAYDRMDIDMLEHMARQARLPEWLWRPMLNMYRAPRMVKMGSTVGEWRYPTHGLVPGCPAATFWMALATYPWIRAMRSLESQRTVRGWVDDLTAYVSGREEAKALVTAGVDEVPVS